MTRKLLLILALMLTSSMSLDASKLKNLRVNRMTEATGIMRTAQFSWQIESKKQDVAQTAYRICVATSRQGIYQESNDRLWDSEQVESPENIQVPYQGRKLPTQKDIYWQVTVWLNNGECIKSPIEKFITGINFADWQAEWIGLGKTADIITEEGGCKDLPARYLRQEFLVRGKITRAVLYLSGMGVSTTYINGKNVCDDILGTLPSEYTKTVYYNTYDVTPLVRRGRNAIATVLGNGYMLGLRKEHTSYGLPRLKAQLVIETDRDTLVIPTSEQWKATSNGPIRANNLYSGELYDARHEQQGWNMPGFDDSSWQQAARMDNPRGMLQPQPSPGRRTQEILLAKSIRKTEDGRYIVDMGQNMVGQLRVKLNGKAGQPVIIRHAERLAPEKGNVIYTDNLRSARCTNTYIPAQDGTFTYQPELVYQGFRYVEICGATDMPKIEDIEGHVQYNQMEQQGTFSCDNELLNQLYRNAFWGIRGNYQGMPVDCPQRDERLGWTGDRVTGCYGENLLFDNASLYYKWLKDIEDTQLENGQISDICPTFLAIYSNNVTWQAAFVYA
ncbi:MAG: family 78 glycoside hydrolase catalytic domain, partial [Bacteroidaceae bacterium]